MVTFVALILVAIAAGWWLTRPVPRIALRRETLERRAATPRLPTSAPRPASITPPAPTTPPSPSAPATTGGPSLALIVDDCGQWPRTERGFLALRVPLTVSILPDVRYTGAIAREATAAGKGVMLHLPMETLSGMNPGPGKITTEMDDAQIVAQVRSDLDQLPLARGVNNHEGSKASADPRVMRAVIGVLAQRGLFFVDSRTSSASVGEATARALNVPSAARDVFLDNRAEVAYTEAQLLAAAAIARQRGSAIAIGHPRPSTLAAVAAMIPQIEASGVHFVLAQQLVTAGSP